MTAPAEPRRPPPPLADDATAFFWASGADGRLRLLRCGGCGHWLHPPRPRCPECLGADVAPAVSTGTGEVHSFTINHQPWFDDPAPPYPLAIVALDDQAGLRLTTRIVGCPVEEVRIGMRVRVCFEPREDVWLPLFRPDREAT